MDQKEFNKSLAGYLDQRLKEAKTKRGHKKLRSVEEEHPDLEERKITIIKGEQSVLGSIKAWFKRKPKVEEAPPQEPEEAPAEEVPAEHEEFEKEEKAAESPKPGFLDKLRDVISAVLPKKSAHAATEVVEVEEEAKEEVVTPEEGFEQEFEEEQHQEKPSGIRAFFSRLFGGPEPEEIAEVEGIAEDANSIIKSLVKTNLTLLKMVPSRKLESFRESDDYKEFRDAVQEYKKLAGLEDKGEDETQA